IEYSTRRNFFVRYLLEEEKEKVSTANLELEKRVLERTSQLMKEKKFSNTIIKASPAFIVAINGDGKLLLMNKSMLNTLGYTKKEAIGSNYIIKFVPESDREMLSKIFNKITNKHQSTFNENRVLTKDGRGLLIEWYSQPVLDNDGKLDFFIFIGIDITERKKTQENLEKSYIKLQKTLKDTIDTLASIIEIRDPYTSGHQKRVAALAISISKELDLDKDRIEAIGTAAIVHDIGKINIPASILARPGKISALEYDMIKTHPQLGYEMIKKIEFSWPIGKIILQHHERLDGSGYPKGLKGNDIVLEAKILAVADVVEAMSSHRPYRPALGIDKATEEIKKGSGKLYGREVVEACVKIITKKGFKF
ncbi:MAG: PAS domain S-box protein, partial [Actinomycetia bacterium]|nr:PAS domain S-box protein [Actinomycetes bacterium]